MAGIGFLLRNLAAQDNFSGVLRAYFHSAIVAVGPWIVVVLTVGSIGFFTSAFIGLSDVEEFLAIIVYNFCSSFILTGGLYLVAARHLADSLYLRDLRPVLGIFYCSLILMLLPAVLLGTLFYVFYATMSPIQTVLSIINFTLLGETWILMLYLSSLRDFRAITTSWVTGAFITIFFAFVLGVMYHTTGMLIGFNIGVTFIVYSMKAHILAEYAFRFDRLETFRHFFRGYGVLFISGICLYGGMWIDKVIMWFAPEALVHLNNLHTYPVYDGAMFYSYLTIIPVMGLFVFSLETNFYDYYIRYVQHIEHNAPLGLIENEKKNIINSLLENGRTFLILQGSISFVTIAASPEIFEWLKLDFLMLPIFLQGVVGAFFAVLNLFIVVIFSYFASYENMFKITLTMTITNIVFTVMTLYLGFPYYGFGYCLSMIVTFLVGSILLADFLNNLTYHIFISNVIKRQRFSEHHKGDEREWYEKKQT